MVLRASWIALVILTAVPATGFGQTLVPQPDSAMIFGVEAPTPEECHRFGLRYWAKRKFASKRACQCVKCGWHWFPPRRLCWRVC